MVNCAILWVLLSVVGLCGGQDQEHQVLEVGGTKMGDQFILTGQWEAKTWRRAADSWTWTFDLDQITSLSFNVQDEDSNWWGGIYDLDETQSPKQINFQITSGLYQSQVALGIYQLIDNEFLLLAVGKPGEKRPKSFDSDDKSWFFESKKLDKPEQVHLAFGEDPETSIVISWVTRRTTGSEVQYGTESGSYTNTTFGISFDYSYDNYTSGIMHRVKLNHLTPSTRYYYICGDYSQGYGKEATFKTIGKQKEIDVLMFADLNVGGQIGPSSCWNVSLGNLGTINEEYADFLIHAGDLAYCFGDQVCWDHFFMTIQPLASRMAYMVCAGNHDVYPEIDGYLNRFYMPGPRGISNLSDGDYFYSFNAGPVHFIALSTELWFYPETQTNFTQQMEWFEQDLKLASNATARKERPWIVFIGHRPIYCTSSYPDCTNDVALTLQRFLEPLFFRYGVDLAFWGHIHSMERTYPIMFDGQIGGTYASPKGTVHITNGSAGEATLGPNIDPPAWSAWRSFSHGYSRLRANMNQLDFDFVDTYGIVLDTITLGEPFLGIQN